MWGLTTETLPQKWVQEMRLVRANERLSGDTGARYGIQRLNITTTSGQLTVAATVMLRVAVSRDARGHRGSWCQPKLPQVKPVLCLLREDSAPFFHITSLPSGLTRPLDGASP